MSAVASWLGYLILLLQKRQKESKRQRQSFAAATNSRHNRSEKYTDILLQLQQTIEASDDLFGQIELAHDAARSEEYGFQQMSSKKVTSEDEQIAPVPSNLNNGKWNLH